MTVEEYIAGAGAREGELALLHRMIVEVAPDLGVSASGAFLVYGPFRYRYASGREGETGRIVVAARKGGSPSISPRGSERQCRGRTRASAV